MDLIKTRLAELTAQMSEAQLSSLAKVAGLIVNGPDMKNAIPVTSLTKPEDIIQATCYKWHREIYRRQSLLYATPNGGQRHKLEAMKLQATGTRKGVADLTLLLPGGKCVFIEMKAPGGKQEPEQMLFQAQVQALGFTYYLIYSFMEFKNLIDKLILEAVEPNKNYI